MPRAMWKGALRFGLIHVPVELHSAVREHRIPLHLLSPDGKRLRNRLYDPESGREYTQDEALRGFDAGEGRHVVLREEELDAIRPDAEEGPVLEVEEFVDVSDIDPVLLHRPLYVVPEPSGAPAYRLLVKALGRTRRAAIVRFVMRRKQYLGALRSVEDTLQLNLLRYADEIVPFSAVGEAPTTRVDPRQLDVAVELVEAMTGTFCPERYRDGYRDRLEALIQRKAEGERVALPSPAAPTAPRATDDLLDALERSLREARKG
jgi:DNA end-binding protein Ku